MQQQKVMRLPAVIAQTGISRSSILAYVKNGTFPAPLRLSARSVGWVEEDVNHWLATRPRAK